MSENSGEKRNRGRPKLDPKRQEEMRKRITDQASKLFKSEGYGAVSMRRSGQGTGCNSDDALHILSVQTFYIEQALE